MSEPFPLRQRLAAYALLVRGGEEDREVLLTRLSSRTGGAGRWTLPGGGVDHGEDLRVAVVREVFEETGLHVRAERVLDVHSVHFVGPRPDGLVEDYHGVHVIFAATIEPGSVGVTPHVVEEDGSTELVAWVPVTDAAGLDLLSGARHALERLAPDL